MKIALVCITVNGEFLLKEFLEHYYPIVDYMVFAEGATKNWCDALNLKETHSTDNTVDIIFNFEDKQNKIFLTHSRETPYKEKLEQINCAMELVPEDTDLVWQVDDDEFMTYEDFEKIKKLIIEEDATYVEYQMLNFFKFFDVIAKGGSSWAYDTPIPRIFKYHKGVKFHSHRPPTILDKDGIDVKTIRPIFYKELSDMGIYCRHYSYINEDRVREKLLYYDKTFPNAHGVKNYYSEIWFKEVWQKWTKENAKELEQKYSVHPTGLGAYTEPFTLQHPIVIQDKIINND